MILSAFQENTLQKRLNKMHQDELEVITVYHQQLANDLKTSSNPLIN